MLDRPQASGHGGFPGKTPHPRQPPALDPLRELGSQQRATDAKAGATESDASGAQREIQQEKPARQQPTGSGGDWGEWKASTRFPPQDIGSMGAELIFLEMPEIPLFTQNLMFKLVQFV